MALDGVCRLCGGKYRRFRPLERWRHPVSGLFPAGPEAGRNRRGDRVRHACLRARDLPALLPSAFWPSRPKSRRWSGLILPGCASHCRPGACRPWRPDDCGPGRPRVMQLGASRQIPDSRTASRQFLVSALDIAASATVLYVLLPDGVMGWPAFLAVYSVAVGLGVLSHVPAGLGVFRDGHHCGTRSDGEYRRGARRAGAVSPDLSCPAFASGRHLRHRYRGAGPLSSSGRVQPAPGWGAADAGCSWPLWRLFSPQCWFFPA